MTPPNCGPQRLARPCGVGLGTMLGVATIGLVLISMCLAQSISQDELIETERKLQASQPNLLVVLLGAVPASSLYTANANTMSSWNNPSYIPNFRFLAQNSMVFLNAYTNIARSSPSRNSLLTSLHPRRQIGIMSDTSAMNSPAFQQGKQTVFTQYMRASNIGVQSVGAGRVFKFAPPTIMYGGFNQYAIPRMGDQDSICGDGFTACVVSGEANLTDSEVTDRAITYLRSFAQNSQRFSLFVGLHRSYADKSYPPWTNTQLEAERVGISLQQFDAAANQQSNPLFTVNAPKRLNQQQVTDIKVATYAANQWADFCLGRLLDELRGLRFWDKTLIIVTSDIAQSTGEFSDVSTDGSSVYEHTTRVPLIIRDPRAPKSFGRASGGRIELVDIATTIYDLMGSKYPPNGPGTNFLKLQGVSLRALMRVYQNDPRQSFNSNVYFALSSRFAAYSEVARCTASSQAFGNLSPGTLLPASVIWTDCALQGLRVDAIAISMRTSLWRYTEYRLLLGNQVIWETEGLVGRELFSHDRDNGYSQTVDGNMYELVNWAPCSPSECPMYVPPSPRPTQPNPSVGLPGDAKPKDFYTAPALPTNSSVARLVRAFSLMIRSVGRDGIYLCSNHGQVNPDDGSCEVCDQSWLRSDCSVSSYTELNAGNDVTPTSSSPTQAPVPPTKPPVGAPTPPLDTSSPTLLQTAAPTSLPTTSVPTVPTPGLTVSPSSPLDRDSCQSLSTMALCARINGCQWLGRNTGCAVPIPTACGCATSMEVVNAFVPADRGSTTQGEWQLFRNPCHATCRGALLPTFQPTESPTGSTLTPTTPAPTFPLGLPFPVNPGEGNAQPVDTLTLYLVVDASANIAAADKYCNSARGAPCIHISAMFYVRVLNILDDYVRRGWSSFRVGVWAYSCQDAVPLWIEIRAPIAGDQVIDVLKKVKDSIVPRGGRCPSKVFQVILDRDATERLISPNRAMVFLQSGVITPADLEPSKANALALRMAGVTTFAIVVTRNAEGQADPDRVTQSRLDALAIVGNAERVFLASPTQGVLALVAMVNPVSAAILAMMHEPSRVLPSSDDGDVPTTFFDSPGYSDPSLNSGSSPAAVIASTMVFMLVALFGSYFTYKRYKARQIGRASGSTTTEQSLEIVVSSPSGDHVGHEEYEVGRASPVKKARRRSLDFSNGGTMITPSLMQQHKALNTNTSMVASSRDPDWDA